ncbi:Asp23/Gls24 family envelope stress response protein [Naumannella huperziae]
MTVVDPRVDVDNSAASQIPAADRGRLRIDRRVVEKIASQAASEVSAAGGTSGGFLGIGARRDFDARPKVSVDLRGDSATIAVTCGVAYPAPLRETTDAVRAHVHDQVERQVGITVDRVDIDVAWLSRADTGVARHLR